MIIRWNDLEFEILDEKDIELFKKIMEALETQGTGDIKRKKTYNTQKIIRSSVEWAYNCLKKILNKLDKDKWYTGVEIIRMAGYDRNAGIFYYALTKLVEDGILEERKEGNRRLFRVKIEKDDFDFKKYWQEERKVMEGVLR